MLLFIVTLTGVTSIMELWFIFCYYWNIGRGDVRHQIMVSILLLFIRTLTAVMSIIELWFIFYNYLLEH